jgi:hypothetical protein
MIPARGGCGLAARSTTGCQPVALPYAVRRGQGLRRHCTNALTLALSQWEREQKEK